MGSSHEVKTDLMKVFVKMRKVNVSLLFGGISQGEYFTLEIIYKFMEKGVNDKGIYVSHLAEKLNVASSAVSRMLNILEAKNLVQREINKDDRRNIYVYLTQEGKNRYINTTNCLNEFLSKVILRMGDDNIKKLISLWNEVSDIMIEELKSNGGDIR